MKTIFKKIFIILIIAMSSMILFAGTTAPSSIISISPIPKYTLRGLNHNLAVQKFYIGTTYLYITQRSGSTTYISRCLMSGAEAWYQDEMTITQGGHGQTLDIYTYNNIDYLLVAIKSNPVNDYYFALQVGRVRYSAGATYNYTDLHRCTYMNYANKTGTSLGTTYRVDGGGNSTYLIFRVQNDVGRIRYSIYNTAALNVLLDKYTQVDMRTTAAKNACYTSFEQNKSDLTDDYMNGSFQGVEMLTNANIYITGGQDGDVPKIARMSNTGDCTKLINVIGYGNHEIEGVMSRDSNVYFLLVMDPVNKQNTQQIFYYPTSSFL